MDVSPERNPARQRQPVVWISHREGERCAGCGTELWRGALVHVSRQSGVRCLACAGLGGLVLLPAGDAALTRRAQALSPRAAVVLKFSRARKRHERQGVLVEEAALERAEEACRQDAARREAVRARRRVRDEAAEQDYQARFRETILGLYPGCPAGDVEAIAERACAKYSGRVGRSRAAKQFEPRAVALAVRAHVRHRYTHYDRLIAAGWEPHEARPEVAAEIERVLERWSGR